MAILAVACVLHCVTRDNCYLHSWLARNARRAAGALGCLVVEARLLKNPLLLAVSLPFGFGNACFGPLKPDLGVHR